MGSDGATIVHWSFPKKDGFLRKQVGPFADQVLVRPVWRSFGAWTAAITGTERRVDTLNKGMVQSALLHIIIRFANNQGKKYLYAPPHPNPVLLINKHSIGALINNYLKFSPGIVRQSL